MVKSSIKVKRVAVDMFQSLDGKKTFICRNGRWRECGKRNNELIQLLLYNEGSRARRISPEIVTNEFSGKSMK